MFAVGGRYTFDCKVKETAKFTDVRYGFGQGEVKIFELMRLSLLDQRSVNMLYIRYI